MKKSSLAPPTAYFFIPLLSFLSRWNIFRWQWRRLTQSERQQLTSRPKEHKNKQCVTEPLSLLYYFFIGKFTISNEIKKSFLSDYCFFLSFFFSRGGSRSRLLLQQHPILILFVNNKIPNFFLVQRFPSDCKIDVETRRRRKRKKEKILSMFVCLIIA